MHSSVVQSSAVRWTGVECSVECSVEQRSGLECNLVQCRTVECNVV
jgi:hypothetical protein